MTTISDWGKTTPYRFLSNFWPDNNDTLEHLYQAAKTDDPDWKFKILTAPDPTTAKRYGRQCPMRPTWDDEKLGVMYNLVANKFSNPTLSFLLTSTNPAILVEGNWWHDTFYGVCNGRGKNCNKHKPEGLNWLGRILMIVRSELLLP